jgi:hypothetical protein
MQAVCVLARLLDTPVATTVTVSCKMWQAGGSRPLLDTLQTCGGYQLTFIPMEDTGAHATDEDINMGQDTLCVDIPANEERVTYTYQPPAYPGDTVSMGQDTRRMSRQAVQHDNLEHPEMLGTLHLHVANRQVHPVRSYWSRARYVKWPDRCIAYMLPCS